MGFIRYEEMSWTGVEQALRERILFIPVGSMEQHGPHLPLNVDAVLAQRISGDVASDRGGIVAPAISYGARSLPNSGGGLDYPGTIYIRGDVLVRTYADIIASFLRAGARRMVLLNAHWENEPFLIEAVENCREDGLVGSSEIAALSWWSVVSEADMIGIFGSFPGWHQEHAGQAETSLMLHYAPELVHMEHAVDYPEAIPAGVYMLPPPAAWKGNMGVLSATRHATPEQGRALADLIRKRLVELLT